MSKNTIETNITPYIASEFPRLFNDNYPLFIAFMQAYEEWMALEGNVGNTNKSLLTYTDVDTTLPIFMSHFQNKYLQGTPLAAAINTPFLVKNIKEMIANKGTPNGVKLFLQLLFNEPSNVYIPGTDVLRASDGIWMQYPYLEISFGVNNKLLIGSIVTGAQSRATAFVRDLKLIPLTASNRIRSVLVLENVRGTFQLGETLQYSDTSISVSNPIIIGSLSDIVITAGGMGYTVGDELKLTSDKGVGGIAIVKSVEPKNGVVVFDIVDGGGSYANSTTDPVNFTQTSVTFSQANTNPGFGATFQIGNLSNTYALTMYSDFIYPFVQAPVASLTVASGGTGYLIGDELIFNRSATDTPPILSSGFGLPALPANNAVVTVKTVDSNGAITALTITNGGEYTAIPTILVNSLNGKNSNLVASLSTALPVIDAPAYGFDQDPTANGSSVISLALTSDTIIVGTIDSLTSINPGEGYTGSVDVSVVSSIIAGMGITTTSDGEIDGQNADITGQASKGEGSISSISVIDSGVGYVVGENLSFKSNNVSTHASGRAVIGSTGTQIGHWQDTRGFLDSDKYIQDSYYYQAFSYEIQSPMPVERYAKTVKDLWHMAGTQMFGRSVIEDSIPRASDMYSDIIYPAVPIADWSVLDLMADTLDPRITFTRASTKTYFDSDGVMQTAAINECPLEYDPVTLKPIGRSFWGARTNLCTQSEFANGLADAPYRSAGVTAVSGLGWPGGISTGIGIPFSSSSTQYVYKSATVANSTTYCLSVFVRMDDGGAPVPGTTTSPTGIDFYLQVGQSQAQTFVVEALAGGVYKVSGIVTTSASASPNEGVAKIATMTGRAFTVSGYDLQVGAFASPYIPTTTAAATRAADFAIVNDLSSIGFLQNAPMTLYVAGTTYADGSGSAYRILSLKQSSGSQRALIYQAGTSLATVVSGGTNILVPNACLAGQPFIAAITLDGIRVSVAANGVLGPRTSVAIPSPVDVLSIGYDVTTSLSQMCGVIRSVRYYPRQLSDSELQALTS